MEMIANASAGADGMKKRGAKADRLRTKGVCPHDGRECRHARRCTLGRADACAALLANVSRACKLCRPANGGRCPFRCFRRDGYFQTGRAI